MGESREQVRRYIRLTELIPEILETVDDGRMALRPAVEISYLTKNEQRMLAEAMDYFQCTPSHAQAIRLRAFSKDGVLGQHLIERIMEEEKPNQRPKISLAYDEARRFIPSSVPYEKTGDYILKALEFYGRHRQRSDRDAR
jgi:ParB family chromosome partitioning protein